MNSEENYMEPNELPDELVNIRYINIYTAPANYFDELAEDIIGKVHLPLLADAPLSVPPSGYFDNLPAAILQKIKNIPVQNDVQKELEEIEPLLTTISKANVYRVPDGYFDSFEVMLPVTKKPVSVIKMRRSKTWMSYAAAAVVTGIIAISIIFFTEQKHDGDGTNYTQALAKVTDNDLSDYLDQTSQDADIISATQDDNEKIDGESLFKLMLNNVSDNELENYLNENNDGDEKNIKGI